MSINADISELGEMMEGIAPLELGDKPMTGKQFITAYQLDEAEKKTETQLVKYSKEDLIKYRQSPLAMGRPVLKDPVVYSMSCWPKSRAAEDEVMKRRSADPRERTRREGDGIILSPQRGNFNNGCAVAPQRQQQPQSQAPHRRIGSGRLLKRDWDGDESLIFRSSHSRDDRLNGMPDGNELRSGRQGDRLGGDDGRFRQRYNDRHSSDSRNGSAAPEWFTCGPTSQDETIDLHGFDNDLPEKVEKPKRKAKSEKEASRNVPRSSSPLPASARGVEPSPPLVQIEEEPKQPEVKPKEKNENTTSAAEDSENFDIDDLLQNDVLTPLFANMSDNAASKSSRFSQFFSSHGREFPGAGSAPDPHLKSILNARRQSQPNETGVALMELFRHEQQRQTAQTGPSLKDLAATGKVTDVAEIEARYRQSLDRDEEQQNGAVSMDDVNPDVQAFIFKRAKQDAVQQRSDTNLLFNMQLQQQLAERNQAALLGKFMVPQHFQQLPPDLQVVIANAKPTVETCTAPEFVNFLSGFLQGRFSIQNIVGQLMATPDVRLQEILIAVLNLTLVNRDPFTLQQIVMQNGLQQQQAQQHRMPSSLELRAHTSNIMQTALLRKKLEEQTENFKKRENLRTEAIAAASRGTSPISHSIGQQGSLMSFTPTAVLRKMTTEDKDGRRIVRGLPVMDGTLSPTQARSPIPTAMSSEAPLSPVFASNPGGSIMPPWGAPLRAITKICEYDPAIGRSNWVATPQNSTPVTFAYRPPMVQQLPTRVAPSATRPRFTFPPPVNRMPPQFRGPVPVSPQGEQSPQVVNSVGPQDEFRPMWNVDPYADIRQRARAPPQGRIINVEELERKTRMQRF